MMANATQMTLEDLIAHSIDRDKHDKTLESPSFETHGLTVRVNQFDKARIDMVARILDISRQELLFKFIDEGLLRAMALLDDKKNAKCDWYSEYIFQSEELQNREDELWNSAN